MSCASEMAVMAVLSESMWNFALQPLNTYLHHQNAHGHQTCQVSDL